MITIFERLNGEKIENTTENLKKLYDELHGEYVERGCSLSQLISSGTIEVSCLHCRRAPTEHQDGKCLFGPERYEPYGEKRTSELTYDVSRIWNELLDRDHEARTPYYGG